MKQIFLVLLVLAALMVGFFVQRKLTEPVKRTAPVATGPQAGTPGATRPALAPNVGTGAGQRQNNPRRPADKLVFVEWKGKASQSSVVPWGETWSLDHSKVDYEAPVLVTIGDLPITQADFRRMICLEVGRSFHLARFSEIIARAQAARRGNQYELTPELHQELLAHQAQSEGIPLEQKLTGIAMQVQLPMQASLEVHRSITASLIYNAVGGDVEQLSPSFLDALRFVGPKDAEGNPVLDDQQRPTAFATVFELREAWNRVNSAAAYDGRTDDIARLSSISKLYSALMQGIRNKDLAARCWTFLDAPMPDDVFVRVALADIDPEADPIAPWLLGGEVVDVRVDELWPQMAGILSDSAKERSLHAVAWFRYLAHALDQAGVLPTAEESFARSVARSNELSSTMFDMTFMSQAEGYPTLHHYRLAQRLFDGHRGTLPIGWDTEATQRPFYEANAFFVERWNPQLDFAYFPALDWTEDEAGNVKWGLDWEKALAEARAIKGKVALGQEFKTLAKSHADALVARMGRYAGQEFAEEYRKRAVAGNTMGTLRTVEEVLGETDYVELLRGTSLVKAIAAYQDVGVVSEPMLIEGGYAVVRLARAELSTYERDWADSKGLCESYYLRSNFLRWSTDQLRSAALTYSR
jgi:hypothetical protein